MGLYTIRQPKYSEIGLIQEFIENHWKKGHALSKSKELLLFQHLDSSSNQLNYYFAQNNETKEIDALFGFIPTSQYDKKLEKNGDYWGAVWKRREDIHNDEACDIGFSVFLRLFDETNFHSFGAIGISKVALQIYKAFKCKVGCLQHYYILNNQIKDYKIAGNVEKSLTEVGDVYISEQGWGVSELMQQDLKSLNISPSYQPIKSINYLVNRYANHPIYKYKFYGVYKEGKVVTILVARFVEAKGSMVIRIVDALGELQGTLYDSFQNIMHETGAEYVDFMNYGIEESIFYEMGFRKLDLQGDLIIPNYFEPFEQRNVKIDVAWKADYNNYVVFKGDSDQDRPNIL